MSEKEIDYQFGLRLSDLREKRGMTQANLAEKMDVSSKTISSYEAHKRNPSIVTVKKAAEALSVSPDYFFNENADDTYVKDLEREPVLALLTVLRIFRFHTHLLDDGTILLTLSDDDKEYNSHGIRSFFSDYEIYQNFLDNNATSDTSGEMGKQLFDFLSRAFLPDDS